jgi:hypothetical protein
MNPSHPPSPCLSIANPLRDVPWQKTGINVKLLRKGKKIDKPLLM